MAAYSGWGGAANAFRSPAEAPTASWAAVSEELSRVLSEDEYASARSSVLTAFYTPEPVVAAIWRALASAGVRPGDHVLEPGCGTGNFMRAVPDGMRIDFTGIEADDVSARIASHLLSDAHIVSGPMEDCYVSPSSFDAVVGNVPYSDSIRIEDPATGRPVPIHDWFVSQSVEAVRPGGLVAVLTSRYTLDKRDATTRRSLAERAELVAAARLPGETFSRQAGTDVVSDVLVLRRRERSVELSPGEEPEWVRTADMGGVTVNALMAARPELALGGVGMEVASGPFGPTVALRRATGVTSEDVGEALATTLSSQLVAAVGHDVHAGMAKALEEPRAVLRPQQADAYVLSLDGEGNLWYGDGESVVAFSPRRASDMDRVRAMVSLRDRHRATVALEQDPSASEAEVVAAISALDGAYESFVARYGRLCERRNRRAIDFGVYPDYSIGRVFALEEVDARGRFAGKADILTTRVQRPEKPMPDHVDDPREAIAVSLDRTGGVDEALVSRLLGLSGDELSDALGDAVVRDPETGRLELADAYLSGDVRGRLDRVRALIREETAGRRDAAVSEWMESQGLGEAALAPSAEAADAVASLRRSGVWESALAPSSSRRAVDVASHMERLRGWGSPVVRHASEIAGMAALAAEPQGTLSEVGPHGIVRWKNALLGALAPHALGEPWRSEGCSLSRSPRLALMRLCRSDALSADDLATMLYAPGAPGSGLAAEAARALGLRVPASLPARGPDAREFALAVARGLKARPVAAEYLLAIEARQAGPDAARGRWGSPASVADLASPSGLAAYEAEREAFVGPRAAADPERVESLRALERRLEEALPDALGPHQVAATLGSSWIPPTVILDFMRETFGAGEGQGAASGRRLEVARDPSTGSWRVRATSSGLSPEAQARWGTAECSCFHLVETALNGSVLAVTRPDPDDPSGRRRVRDPQATAAAWQRRHRIEEAFAEWVWSDEDRSRMLCEIYNRQFNGLAPRRYDGSYLTLPGMSPSVTLERHQLDAVARILQSDEGTLVAHAVGAGKTFTGIVACHEAKRLGNASKPMIVVPNHITQQWASDFLRLYPDAKVLYMDAADTRSADAVRAFWARAAAGDWDAVIVGQSRFSQLNVSAETRERYFEARLEEMERSIRAAKEDGQDFTVKEAERTKRQLQGRLDRLRRDRSLAGISFEDLGCDMLVVDEAHSFKNLAVTGVQTAGMAVSPSAKCEDLLDKCRWLRERGKGRNIVFETGTPVSNTMAELYNMQRYLSPALLAAQGVESFSSWANTFGQLTESVEVRPEGTGFQIKQRFGRFHNLPELMGAFHCFADVMTAETLDLPVPECEVVTVAVPATPEQEECVRELAKRAEAVRDRSVDPSDDNMLRITGDGRKVALDPKLLSPDDPDVAPLEGGKVARCAEEVKRIWDETSAERGAQLVFCDTSTPAGGGWNVYADLKRRLVELGVPEDEVRFVSDAGDNPTKRDELFEMVRAGEVRVLVGSTQKLGTGTNCQDRLAAIHDLDCPWRPSDLEQRLGRIRRRGNMYDRVRDYRYVSTGTFDAYLYQIVERKQRFIGQVFTDRSPARAVDDLDETVLSFAEIKMLATGDPDVARRMELENEIGQLRLLEQAHASQAASIARQVECRYRPQAKALRERSGQLGRDKAAFSRATDAALGDEPPVEVGGVVPVERAEAVRALRSAALGLRTGSSGRIGTYRGLDVWAVRRQALGGRDGIECVTHVGLAAHGSDSVHWCDKPFPASDTGPGTVLRQMDRLAEREARGPELVAEWLEEAERRLAEAERAMSEGWDGADELRRKREELRALDEARGLSRAHGPAAPETAPEPEPAPPAPPAPTAAEVMDRARRASESAARARGEGAGRSVAPPRPRP